jgi:hypothetical protein
MNRQYPPEDIEKIINDLYLMVEECKLVWETYRPCPENIAVQLYQLNEMMKILNAEMEKMKKVLLPE